MFRFLSALRSISRLSIRTPQASTDRHGLAVVSIVKNEAEYIAEWVDFHHRAGVRSFYIYDNGSTDRTVAVLCRNLPSEAVHVIPWNQQVMDAVTGSALHNQTLAYAHAACNFGAAYRWMAFIDVDEFLIPKQAHTLPAALEPLQDQANISLPWHMYGTSGHKTRPQGSVLENYVLRHRDPMSSHKGLRNFKCIVDPCRLTSIRVHSMATDGRWKTVNDAGKIVAAGMRDARSFYSAGHIQLNHYYTRSEEEFERKRSKGHIDAARSARYAEKLKDILTAIDSDPVEDRCALDFLARIDSRV